MWFEQWRDERPLIETSVDWEVFKKAFLGRFFCISLWKIKLVEFMNLHQWRMSVKEYSLKVTQLCKYAPTLVANSRASMNKFVIGVSSMVEKECRTPMLHYDIGYL